MPNFGFLPPNLVRKGYNRTVASTAQIKNAFSTPIIVIPATPGYWAVPTYATINKAAGTAYVLNGNGSLDLRFLNSSGAFVTTVSGFSVTPLTNFLDQNAATYVQTAGSLVFQFKNASALVGGALDVKLDAANMVTGEGSVEFCFIYDLIPSNFLFL